jgi:hypothetical protein
MIAKTHSQALTSPLGKPRARGLGLPLPGTPGPLNAITDVAGVEVGYETLIRGDAVRTGVTAILPRPRQKLLNPVWASLFSLNGNGEMTGSHWIRDGGWFTRSRSQSRSQSASPTMQRFDGWPRSFRPRWRNSLGSCRSRPRPTTVG